MDGEESVALAASAATVTPAKPFGRSNTTSIRPPGIIEQALVVVLAAVVAAVVFLKLLSLRLISALALVESFLFPGREECCDCEQAKAKDSGLAQRASSTS